MFDNNETGAGNNQEQPKKKTRPSTIDHLHSSNYIAGEPVVNDKAEVAAVVIKDTMLPLEFAMTQVEPKITLKQADGRQPGEYFDRLSTYICEQLHLDPKSAEFEFINQFSFELSLSGVYMSNLSKAGSRYKERVDPLVDSGVLEDAHPVIAYQRLLAEFNRTIDVAVDEERYLTKKELDQFIKAFEVMAKRLRDREHEYFDPDAEVTLLEQPWLTLYFLWEIRKAVLNAVA